MSENTIAEEDVFKYYVLVENGYKYFAPQYTAVEAATKWVFPVPASNAVGTIDAYGNGIVLVKFNADANASEHETVAQNFSELAFDRYAYYRFSHDFIDDKIVCSCDNIAMMANLKTSEAFQIECGLSMDDCMREISLLDPSNNLFAVERAIYMDSKEHFDFLDIDGLIVLGQVTGMISIAWTSEPTSFVVSSGELLHKWDLDELPSARVFVIPEENDGKKGGVFKKIGVLFRKKG